jgi:parallel beta-helix repeat protein
VPTVQYPTIQAAINAANSGDTIEVASGVYNENIVVNKSVSLVGKNPSNTTIDGSGTERNTVHVTANNVRIEGFTIQNGENPFEPSSFSIWYSRGHIIRNNIIRQSIRGIIIRNSNDSVIADNVIANNTNGILIVDGNGNNIIGNLIRNNTNGALTQFTTGFITISLNRFYHNNFINNPLHQAYSLNPTTKWDNGAEGNFWSDYNGPDLNGDGIGDTGISSPHLGLDYYPLIEKWSETRDFTAVWKGVTYHAIVRSNSTCVRTSLNFNYSLAQISFNITSPKNADGSCNVTIEKAFLDGNFMVLVNRTSTNHIPTYNSTYTSLRFTFSRSTNSTRKIQIRGTIVIGNPIPVANFTYSPNPKEGQDTQFTDASTDPNGTVIAWLWDFGDGNKSSQQNPVNRFMKKGTYNVTLTVKDNENVTNTLTKTIIVASSLFDYTLYYILAGIVSGALILGAALFLLKKKKKPSSSTKITE